MPGLSIIVTETLSAEDPNSNRSRPVPMWSIQYYEELFENNYFHISSNHITIQITASKPIHSRQHGTALLFWGHTVPAGLLHWVLCCALLQSKEMPVSHHSESCGTGTQQHRNQSQTTWENAMYSNCAENVPEIRQPADLRQARIWLYTQISFINMLF